MDFAHNTEEMHFRWLDGRYWRDQSFEKTSYLISKISVKYHVENPYICICLSECGLVYSF